MSDIRAQERPVLGISSPSAIKINFLCLEIRPLNPRAMRERVGRSSVLAENVSRSKVVAGLVDQTKPEAFSFS